MKASANRTQDNESRAVANNVSCKREEREAGRFVDNSSHTKSIAQLQAIADRSVNPHDVQMRKLFAIINNSPQRKTPVLPGVTQKKGPLDEEELQFKSKEAVQKKGPLDEEELQFKKDETVQCKGPLDEEELQFKAEEPVQKQENRTGLPDDLKAGVENLSGMAMDDVRVHYNSGKPAQLNAYAYTQGTEIHVAPGQEKHLPHEAWHVVQQKQGRVQPTVQMAGGVAVNDDKGLEKEADGMGEKMDTQDLSIGSTKKCRQISRKGICLETNQSGDIESKDLIQAVWHQNKIGSILQFGKFDEKKLITSKGGKYKKKDKERDEQLDVDEKLDDQVNQWISTYGHAQERHVGKSTAQLDARNIPVATTFETDSDLKIAAKSLLVINERKLNHWYENTDDTRIVIWGHLPSDCMVRGRKRLERPSWHQHQPVMPPHPGYADIDPQDLLYCIGVFDRDQWNNAPKGLMTCFPSLDNITN